jgi:hypothetical protein
VSSLGKITGRRLMDKVASTTPVPTIVGDVAATESAGDGPDVKDHQYHTSTDGVRTMRRVQCSTKRPGRPLLRAAR